MTRRELIEKRAALQTESDGLLAAIENNTLTPEQEARLDSIGSETDGIDSQIATLDAAASRIRAAAKRAPATVHDNAQDRPFRSMGEMLHCVARHEMSTGREFDPRLRNLASGQSEGTPADGGFLVVPEYASGIFEVAHNVGVVAPRCRQMVLSGNAIKVPSIDETSRADGSRWGGIRAYWAAEAGTVTAAKAATRQLSIELLKLMALTYATDELLQDVAAMDSWIRATLPKEIAFKLDDAIVNGSGTGAPLGILASSAYVSVTKVGSQTATTLVAGNITSMWARLHPACRANAVWLINPDAEGQLPLMTIGQMPVYLPGGTLINPGPSGTLLGRPVIPCEQCATLGTVGDIILGDLSQYLLATKGGVQGDVSMHVRFIYGEQTFRFTLRVNGAPLWYSAITPFKGSLTQAPFCTTETRS